jgi:diacylglycerol kinase family enzyme
MRVVVLLNSGAGTLRGLDPGAAGEQVAQIFRERGHEVRTEVHAGPAIVAAIARICGEGNADAVVVGGGDGTISAAAAAAAEHGITLGVLPLGTMNLFARSLGTPLTMRSAAEALADGHPVRVDMGVVNGRPFIHHVTLGLHPRIVRFREKLNYSSRGGKIVAGMQAWWAVLRKPPRLDATLTVDGQRADRRATAILVSNNPLGEGHLPYADDLRGGKLGLYVTESARWHDLIELAARMSLGEFSQNPLLEAWRAETVEIGLRRDSVRASVDGEIVRLQPPLRFAIRKGGLTVLQPLRRAPLPESRARRIAAKDGTGAPG